MRPIWLYVYIYREIDRCARADGSSGARSAGGSGVEKQVVVVVVVAVAEVVVVVAVVVVLKFENQDKTKNGTQNDHTMSKRINAKMQIR